MQEDKGDKLTRRTVVGAAAGAVALVSDPRSPSVCRSRLAPRGHSSGSTWTSGRLDEAYDQSVYAFNREAIFERDDEPVASALARIGPPHRVAYGRAEIEKVDIYRTQRANAPTLIFIHGGVWSTGRAANHTELAEMFIKAGAHFVAVDFSSVDDTGGDLTKLVDQCRRAVAFPSQCGELRRQRRSDLPERPFLRRPSRGLRAHHRVGEGRACRRTHQGRAALQRHVRSQARASFEPVELREVRPTRSKTR